jgi:hypothetical protein
VLLSNYVRKRCWELTGVSVGPFWLADMWNNVNVASLSSGGAGLHVNSREETYSCYPNGLDWPMLRMPIKLASLVAVLVHALSMRLDRGLGHAL